ncbi:MAG: carbon-nitrogen hydrolase family protein [Verrucomicrobiales bacterium]|jgi:predicted amidohydrolase
MRLGLGQILVEGGQREANLARAEVAIRTLAENGAEIILLPEALNLGWTHPSCHTEAEHLPDGISCQHLSQLAKELRVHVVAGLIERDNHGIYNAAVLIDQDGDVILRHRKINELDIAHDCYANGTSLNVDDTALGRLGVMICADGFVKDLSISRTLAQMGAEIILSPCAWAVPPGFDQIATPYGQIWLDSYSSICREYGISIAGCSNVGPIEDGPWSGYRCIGNSIVMGPLGQATLTGPHGEVGYLTVNVL